MSLVSECDCEQPRFERSRSQMVCNGPAGGDPRSYPLPNPRARAPAAVARPRPREAPSATGLLQADLLNLTCLLVTKRSYLEIKSHELNLVTGGHFKCSHAQSALDLALLPIGDAQSSCVMRAPWIAIKITWSCVFCCVCVCRSYYFFFLFFVR